MTDTTSDPNVNKALFVNLVMMLTSSVMQQLGKLKDPITDEVEVNLEGAQVSIDMLSMLREKTKGNLDQDEQRMIDDSLSSLQMNYVQVANESPEGAAEPEKQASEAPAGNGSREEGDKQPAPEIKQEPGATPKYHKSYGE